MPNNTTGPQTIRRKHEWERGDPAHYWTSSIMDSMYCFYLPPYCRGGPRLQKTSNSLLSCLWLASSALSVGSRSSSALQHISKRCIPPGRPTVGSHLVFPRREGFSVSLSHQAWCSSPLRSKKDHARVHRCSLLLGSVLLFFFFGFTSTGIIPPRGAKLV